MIIGNNNFNNNMNNNFEKRFNTVTNEGKKIQQNQNNTIKSSQIMQHNNINNRKEMLDKSFDMIQQRYQQGLISLDEFNRQCSLLNKQRNK